MKRDEASEIKRDKAKAVKNSGRGFRKGDATLHCFLVDYKHYAKSYTITRNNWLKIAKDSWKSTYKYPCLSLVLGEESDTKIAVIDTEVFYEMAVGDHDLERFLIHKVHNNTSFTLSRDFWLKHRKDSWADSTKLPCVNVQLGLDSEVSLSCIPWSSFRAMIIGTIYE